MCFSSFRIVFILLLGRYIPLMEGRCGCFDILGLALGYFPPPVGLINLIFFFPIGCRTTRLNISWHISNMHKCARIGKTRNHTWHSNTCNILPLVLYLICAGGRTMGSSKSAEKTPVACLTVVQVVVEMRLAIIQECGQL